MIVPQDPALGWAQAAMANERHAMGLALTTYCIHIYQCQCLVSCVEEMKSIELKTQPACK